MKAKSTLLMIFLVLGLGLGSSWAASDTIDWHTYESGMARSRFEKKKVFLYFYADWCTYCARMERETFKDPAVIAAINRNFIPIRIDADRERAAVAMYQVKGLPFLVFLSESGEKIAHVPQFVSADNMKKILNVLMSASDAK